MGGLCSGPAKTEQERAIEDRLAKAENEDKKVKKLLFLGAGGSGKSTLFKQLKVIHGDYENNKPGLTKEELESYTPTVYLNIVVGLKTLIEGCEELEFTIDAQDAADTVASWPHEKTISADSISVINKVWSDKGIQDAWGHRGTLQVQDTVKYFIKNLERISKDDYMPNTDDVLHVRSRTTGIVEQKFRINGHPFLVVDVGGQKNERKKWIHAFDGVTAVIYVAALSAYDQTLYEDDDQNRMIESLKVFKDVLSWSIFKRTDIILFLNKSDLFAEKLLRHPITMCFEEYDGSKGLEAGSQDDVKASYDYIRKKFHEQNANPKERQIFTHMTCATDTTMIEKIFNDVQRIIIDKALRAINLL